MSESVKDEGAGIVVCWIACAAPCASAILGVVLAPWWLSLPLGAVWVISWGYIVATDNPTPSAPEVGR